MSIKPPIKDIQGKVMEIKFPVKYDFNNIQPKSYSTAKQEFGGKSYFSIPSVSPAYFSPSFTAMKKKDFVGTDRYIVEKYNAPINTFNSHKDFDAWAEEKCEEIKNKDFKGINEETTKKRKEVLYNWWDTFFESIYTPAQQLLIMDDVTKGLEENNYTIPPECNGNVLLQTLYTVINDIEGNPNKKDCDFNKIYQTNLKTFNKSRKNMSYIELNKPSTGTNITGWINIPSQRNNPKKYRDNLIKYRVLSNSWCSKTNNDLKKYDQHFYLDNGVPKICITFLNGEVDKIINVDNHNEIPFKYYDECLRYLKENNSNAEYLEHRKKVMKKYAPIIKDFKNSTPEEILEKLDMEPKKDKNGMISISHFDRSEKMKKDGVTFEDLEIDLEELLKNVKEIKGNADFKNLTIKEIPNLEVIGGDANFFQVKIDKMSKLREVKGRGNFGGAKINDLSGLERIGGNAKLNRSIIGDMSSFREFGNEYALQYAEIDDLSGLKTLKKGVFHCVKIGNLSGLETIEGDAYFTSSKIGNLSGLKKICGEVLCLDTVIDDMSGLTSIGGNAYFNNSIIKGKGLPNLREIGESANFKGAKIDNLEELLEHFKEKLKS